MLHCSKTNFIKSRDFRVSAFTLIEVLFVIAMMGVFATLVAVNFDALIASADVESKDVTIRKAILGGRQLSLHYKEELVLTYDDEESSLQIFTQGGELLEEWKFSSELDNETAVRFELFISQQLQDYQKEPELKEVSQVRFSSRGVCQPFQVSYSNGGGEEILVIDPFTALPVTPEEEEL